nr:(2Fe-2S)-binding protein [Hymenobacter gummosus]
MTGTAAEAAEAPAAAPAAPSPRPADELRPVTLRINGQSHRLQLEPRVMLLDALREQLHLTGTKKGCDHGQCGACTVHIDGQSALSCLTLAVMSEGRAITTIEGLARGEELHPVQEAFVKHDAFQCGYCTPGQIMAATALVQDRQQRSAAEIREAMSGNLCRCAAYANIIAAIQEAQRA